MRRRAAITCCGLLLACAPIAARAAAEPGWATVDGALGMEGKVLAGGVHRYGWPRSDLHVKVGDVAVQPALALGSWAGFVAAGAGGQAMTMGDLVLADNEVAPVVAALQEGGLEVAAIHNHLLGETPRVVYVHFMGRGDAAALARAVRGALARTATPAPPSPAAKVEPTAAEQAAFAAVQSALGRTGTLAGHVLQVGVPRAERIEDGGMEVPASLGVSIAMNFQLDGARVATTGDFVLLATEVNPVIAALRAHGIAVTALHSHMLGESPRLFFLHFWGVDEPRRIGEALAAALGHVNAKPAR